MIILERLKSLLDTLDMYPYVSFTFEDGYSGLKYGLIEQQTDFEEKEFLRSPLLVRDRKGLQKSATWESNKSSFFGGNFLVGLRGNKYLCSHDVWSPSVDALFMLNELENASINLSQCKSITDIGCGTGVISIDLAGKNRSIESINFVDINQKALFMSNTNSYLNGICAKTSYNSQCSNTQGQADIVLTTPYYIPVRRQIIKSPHDDILQAAYETADLINLSMDMALKYAFFIYSSCTEKEVVKRISKKFDVLAHKEVLFTIGDNVGNGTLVSQAVNEGRLEQRGNDYYHTLYLGAYKR